MRVMTPADGLALVTGASSGIGREVALRLAREGFKVVAIARKAAELERLAAEASGAKGAILPFPGDVADRARMQAIIATAEEREGPIALALFNAGLYLPVDMTRPDAALFERSFAVNVLGAVYGLEPLLPRMVARGKGHIALVSSVAGYRGLPTSAAYGATKAALIHLAEAMRIELERHSIHVQVITPGFVETPAQDANTFAKPFMVSAAEAGRRIVRGLKRRTFEITFPKRFTLLMQLLSILPYGWYFPLVRRRTGWDRRD